jgi:hypothetical protein
MRKVALIEAATLKDGAGLQQGQKMLAIGNREVSVGRHWQSSFA